MKIKFKTNLDNYQNSKLFPQLENITPQNGQKVSICKEYIKHYRDKKLPTKLQIVDVIYNEDYIECELWYCSNDIEFAKINKINLF